MNLAGERSVYKPQDTLKERSHTVNMKQIQVSVLQRRSERIYNSLTSLCHETFKI